MSGPQANGKKVRLTRGPKGTHVRASEPQSVVQSAEASSSSREGHGPFREVDSYASHRALLRESEKERPRAATRVEHPTSLGGPAEVDDSVEGCRAQRIVNIPVPQRDLGEFLGVHAESEPPSRLAVAPRTGKNGVFVGAGSNSEELRSWNPGAPAPCDAVGRRPNACAYARDF